MTYLFEFVHVYVQLVPKLRLRLGECSDLVLQMARFVRFGFGILLLPVMAR